MTREQTGLLLCLLSAAAFSTSTLFGRVALDDGAGVVTILALRYAGASPLFWGIVGLAGQPLPSWPAAARVLGLGATLVALQAILFYAALARLDAGLVTLLLYTFPTMVAIGAVAIGREQPSSRKAAAVLVATVGVVLVLVGNAHADTDLVGIALGLASALSCASWVLLSDRVLAGMPSLVVSALISTGAATTLCLVGLAMGALQFSFGPAGWAAILATILVSTVLAISTSLAGLARVGPTVTSILLTMEVPLAVTWATLLLGERLEPVQVGGGVLVVAAVILLQAGTIRWPARSLADEAPRVSSEALRQD
jgi:drug/metabolite transporter (DMT)-like permease